MCISIRESNYALQVKTRSGPLVIFICKMTNKGSNIQMSILEIY